MVIKDNKKVYHYIDTQGNNKEVITWINNYEKQDNWDHARPRLNHGMDLNLEMFVHMWSSTYYQPCLWLYNHTFTIFLSHFGDTFDLHKFNPSWGKDAIM